MLHIVSWIVFFHNKFYKILVFGLYGKSTLQRNKSNLFLLTFSFFFVDPACLFHYVKISCSQTLKYHKFQFLFCVIFAIETKPLFCPTFPLIFNGNLEIFRSYSTQIFHRYNLSTTGHIFTVLVFHRTTIP